jgi:1,4-dihydroxy-2-naphthoate octaprenyltransferase
MVVKLGVEKAKVYHYFLVVTALVTALIYVFLDYSSSYQLIFLVAFIPLVRNMITVSKNEVPAALDGELKKVALSTFLFALLFGIGQFF